MIGDSLVLVVELTALFLGVAFLVHLFQRRTGPERLRAWMGGRPVAAALKGIVVGFLTPFCTYSAIPVLVGLRQAGVPPAGYVAFIVAAPVLDPVLFGALVLITGLDTAVLYLGVALAAALALAMIAERSDIERHLLPLPSTVAVEAGSPGVPASGAAGPAASCESGAPPWRGWPVESRAATLAAVSLLRSVGPLLLVGAGVGLLIEMLVSPDTAARLTGDGALAIPVAAALGTPLYFHTELFVPIAGSLRSAGVGIGAIVALTISGAGANLPELIILRRLARPRLIAILFGYVFAVATLGGLLAQALVG